ncbi:MAG: hypothetical protein ABJO38_11520, partial [Stappiaceae bacterium]
STLIVVGWMLIGGAGCVFLGLSISTFVIKPTDDISALIPIVTAALFPGSLGLILLSLGKRLAATYGMLPLLRDR